MSKCPPGVDLVFLGASIASAISADLTAEEATLLAALFAAVGDNLAIIAIQMEFCDAPK